MLSGDTIRVEGKKDFDEKCTGDYFVNMANNVRTLHKKNNSLCMHSSLSFEFIPFISLEDVKAYEELHKDATPFKRCGNCFKKR